MFIGRKNELSIFNRFFQDSHFKGMVLYGRRRIGKTELIKEALAKRRKEGDCKIVYFECKQAALEMNFQLLQRDVRSVFNQDRLGFADFYDLIDFLFQESRNEEIILVLDEYPYLKECAPEVDSMLQGMIDQWKYQTKLKLILSGSYIDVMKSILEKQNPLHGRLEYQIKLEAMDYYESGLFYPSFTPEDKVRLYSVFGGIPYYNSLIRENLSVQENIEILAASQNAQLGTEIPLLLDSEVRKISNANEVFHALATGLSRFKQIAAKTGIQEKTLTIILNKLISLGLVEKDTPINDRNNSKKVMYFIKDRFSLFYYTFIYPNTAQLVMFDSKLFYELFIEERFEKDFTPRCFERVCREYLIRANNSRMLRPPFYDIGRYYYDLPKEKRNGEFDNVTKSKNGYIFYESKFTRSPISSHMIEKEIDQVNQCGLNCSQYGFISRSGFDPVQRDDLILIDISALYDKRLDY